MADLSAQRVEAASVDVPQQQPALAARPEATVPTVRPTKSLAEMATEKPAVSLALTPGRNPHTRVESIPIWLCWALFAGSVTILILQIWNYLS